MYIGIKTTIYYCGDEFELDNYVVFCHEVVYFVYGCNLNHIYKASISNRGYMFECPITSISF